MKGLIQGLPAGPLGSIGPGGELGYGHVVFGEGAGFIHGQNRGATEAFHRRRPAGQYPKAGQPQGPKGQKQGQHHGDFVGQHGQGQGQGCQQGLGPVAAGDPLNAGQGSAEAQAPQGEPAREPAGAALQAGGGWHDRLEAVAHAAQFAGGGDGFDLGPTPAARHERSGQDPLAEPLLGDRQRLPGEEGFIEP